MMNLTREESLAWIARRRSVFPKEFEEGQLSMDEVKEALSAARWAPTHKSTQPWRFIVFTGEAKAKLAQVQIEALYNKAGKSEDSDTKAKKFQMISDRSTAVVAVVMKRDELERLPQHEEEWAVAAAIQNVHNHAMSMNIGMYWSTGAAKGLPEVLELLGIGEKDLHMGWLYMGRYSSTKTLVKERNSVENYVEWRD